MMIYYLIKMILASGGMYLIYQLVLADEPIFRFNRVYLLMASLVPVIVPLLNWSFLLETEWVLVETISTGTNLLGSDALEVSEEVSSIDFLVGIEYLFMLVSSLMLVRFLGQIIKTYHYIQQGEIIVQDRYKLVLITGNYPPQSIFQFIFLGKKEFEKGELNSFILDHELAHIQQGHTWDILLIEILLVVFWFNPFFYFLRRSIRLNHEFLADQAVVQDLSSPALYQKNLLEYIGQSNALRLASSFNFKMIKKRFLMMTRRKKTFLSLLKQGMTLPLVIGICVLFSWPVEGQNEHLNKTEKPKVKRLKEVQPKSVATKSKVIKPGPGLTEAELQQYASILKKYGVNMDGSGKMTGAFAKADIQTLKELYGQMSTEQRKNQPFKVWLRPPILKSTPSRQQLEEWSQHSYFHVFIDGKRVENEVLNQYKNYQFTRHEVNLESMVTDSGKKKRYWKVELMLPDYYRQQVEKAKQAGAKDEFTFMMAIKKSE